MKLKIVILFLYLLFFSSIFAQNSGSYTFHFPDIKVIIAESPVSLSNINFIEAKRENAPPKVNNRIKRMLLNHYFDSGLDSNESIIKVSDIYFNTVKVSFGSNSFFIVIFKGPPLLTSKIFTYNEQLDSVLETEIDYKIHAMYDINDSGILTDSNLKKAFKMIAPDIELTDSGFKLRRLYHNGTINTTETSVYKIEGKRLIRTFFNSEPLP